MVRAKNKKNNREAEGSINIPVRAKVKVVAAASERRAWERPVYDVRVKDVTVRDRQRQSHGRKRED
jgi:hypothetical protein